MASFIRVVDTDSGGITGDTRVSDGCTVGQYFRENKPGANLADYRVRVNEATATANTMIRDGDTVSISRNKLAGARLRGLLVAVGGCRPRSFR